MSYAQADNIDDDQKYKIAPFQLNSNMIVDDKIVLQIINIPGDYWLFG